MPSTSREGGKRPTAGKCICELCTCGRHRCPTGVHKQPKRAPFEGQTEASRAFVAQECDRPRPFRPKDNTNPDRDAPFFADTEAKVAFTGKYVKPATPKVAKPNLESQHKEPFSAVTETQARFPQYDRYTVPRKKTPAALPKSKPFDGTTESSQAFLAHPVQPRKKKTPRKWEPTGAKLDATSEARRAFAGATGVPAKPFKPKAQPIEAAKFDGVTTSQAAFVNSKIEKRPAYKPHSEFRPPSGKFDGATTSNTNFIAFNPADARQASMKPKAQAIEKTKFDGSTEASRQFVAKPVKPRKQQPKREYVPSKARFNGTTEASASYMGARAAPPKPFKPSGAYEPAPGKFDGTTTAGATFVEYDMEAARQKSMRPARREIEPAKFDGTTENMRQFTPKAGERAQPKKKPEYKPSGAKFYGESEARRAFAGMTGSKRDPIRREQEYKVPQSKFEGVTTAQANYYAKDIAAARQKSMRPQAQKLEPAKFDGATESSMQFTKKKTVPRKQRTPRKYRPSSAKFDGRTEAHDQFYGAAGTRAKPFKPSAEYQPSKGRFDGTTTAAANYVEFNPVDARQPSMRPKVERAPPTKFEGTSEAQRQFYKKPVEKVKQKAPRKYVPNKEKFYSETETGAAFHGTKGERPTPFKPHTELRPDSSAKFDGTTEANRRFAGANVVPMKRFNAGAQKHAFEAEVKSKPPQPTSKSDFAGRTTKPRTPFRPKAQKMDTGKFEAVTEASATFTAAGAPVTRKPYKPKGNGVMFDGKFEGKTTANDAFTGVVGERPKPFRPKRGEKVDARFEGVTESQAVFAAPRGATPAKPIRREANYRPPSGRFYGETTAQASFVPKTPEVCPGTYLEEKGHGSHAHMMKFDGKDMGAKDRAVSRHRHTLRFTQVRANGHVEYDYK